MARPTSKDVTRADLDYRGERRLKLADLLSDLSGPASAPCDGGASLAADLLVVIAAGAVAPRPTPRHITGRKPVPALSAEFPDPAVSCALHGLGTHAAALGA
jgi:hypothetical protein